ncbi:hypothetical protein BJY52DRAFT_1230257 [Lactarius psammicola]|nr:hypothetical protein BJY52DRAFT_1230257 [Lactarius psammicola]
MLLFSTTTAMRGGSSRILHWSDMFVSYIPMDDLCLGKKVPVLAALADNAKHNQQGHVDKHGALQHRLVELCPIGAISRLFFTFFHIMKWPLPNFTPNFATDGYGEYGYWEWYDYHVFAGKEGAKSKMSYDNHLKRISVMHKENSVNITKSTHTGRCYGAMNSYVVAHLFPWVEVELATLKVRMTLSCRNWDIALRQFLKLLQWLCVVLVQDCALLYACMRGYATDLQMKQEQNHSKLCDELRELREQTARLELLLGTFKGSKHKTTIMPPPLTIPSPPRLAPLGVGPPMCAVTDTSSPLLPFSPLPGSPPLPTVTAILSLVSTASPVAANQPIASLAP